VFFGGIGGPLLASVGNALAMHYLKTPDLNSNLAELMFAGLLSAGWPWAWPVVWSVLKKRIKGLALLDDFKGRFASDFAAAVQRGLNQDQSSQRYLPSPRGSGFGGGDLA
jgi:hypothetical protein